MVIFKKWLIFAVPNEGIRGVAQLASASGLGPEGPVFESQYPDKGRGDDDESPPFFDSGNLEGTFTHGTIGKARMKTAQNINGNCSGYGTHCHNTEH